MILYLDTSALVKIYLREDHSDIVCKAMDKADTIATHKVAFVEAHCAFARSLREKIFDESAHRILKKAFIKEWDDYLKIGLSTKLLQAAAEFVEAFALRAYDSLHLAAAHFLFKQGNEKVTFACFDHKLNQAAKVLGLELLNVH